MDISKIQANKMELSIAPCDPQETVHKVVKIMQGKAQGKGIELKFVSCFELPPALELDSSRLNQVVLNILSNALKFTQQCGVTVELDWKPVLNSQLLRGDGSLTDFLIDECSHQLLLPYNREYNPSCKMRLKYLNSAREKTRR